MITDRADFIGVLYRTKDGSSVSVGTSGSMVVDFERNAPLGVSLASNEGSCGFFQMVTKDLVDRC